MIPVWARVVLTVGLLALLLWLLPVDAVWDAITRVSPLRWLLGFALLVAGQTLGALKWRLLLRAAGTPLGFVEVFRAHQAGLLSNAFLPSVVGGDVVRMGVLARRSSSERVVAAGLADRLLDTASLLLLPVVGALVLPVALAEDGRGMLRRMAVVLAVAAGLGVLALLVVRRLPLPEKLAGWMERLCDAFAALLRRPVTALAAAALSLGVQSLFVLINAHLGSLMGISIPLAGWFLAWPLAKLVALVPVSLGGIGVREAALALFLLPLAVEPSLAVAESLLWESMLIAQALLAGLLVTLLPAPAGAPGAEPGAGSAGAEP